ncbi:GerAB/ArcD/ProY family transporter [Bacillus infantis]|uniref:GerAB/ArcD/ProY family transporter n=1 Tax=Bacillus infantis TaxID=324767 RepID=UPI003981FB2F
MKVKTRIDQQDLFFLLLQTQIGAGILSMPYSLYMAAKNDGWISLLLAAAAIFSLIYFYWLLCRRFPHQTLFDFSGKVFGKWGGALINLGYICYFVSTALLVYLNFADIIGRWVLLDTPRWLLILLLMFIAVSACSGSFSSIVSLFSFTSVFIVFLFILSLFIFKEPEIDYRYMFPVASQGVLPILRGAKEAVYGFLGVETALFFLAFVREPEKKGAVKGAFLAQIVISVFYLYLFMASIIMFSPKEIVLIPEPVLYMLKAITFKIIERLDLVFITVWMTAAATTIISYTYLAGMGLSKLLKIKHRRAVLAATGIIFILTFIPQGEMEITSISRAVSFAGLIFSSALPLVLYIAAAFLKKGGAGL